MTQKIYKKKQDWKQNFKQQGIKKCLTTAGVGKLILGVTIVILILSPLYQPWIDYNPTYSVTEKPINISDLEDGVYSFNGKIKIEGGVINGVKEVKKEKLYNFLGFSDFKSFSQYAFSYHSLFIVSIILGVLVAYVEKRVKVYTKTLFFLLTIVSVFGLIWLYAPMRNLSIEMYRASLIVGAIIGAICVYLLFDFLIWRKNIWEALKLSINYNFKQYETNLAEMAARGISGNSEIKIRRTYNDMGKEFDEKMIEITEKI